MPHITSTESVRPFVPAKNFALSKQFYVELGFTLLMDSPEVAIFKMGNSSFLLQNHYSKEWAENFMMQLMVDNLDAWWAHLSTLDLPARYQVSRIHPPAMQPWGLRIVFVTDPSGVLWHVAQRRADVHHDQ